MLIYHMQGKKHLFQEKKLYLPFLDMQIQFCISGKNRSGGVLVHSQNTAGLVGHGSAAALCCDAGEREVRERWWEREREGERETVGGRKREREEFIAVFSICTLLRGRHRKKLEFAVSLTFNILLWLQMLLGPLGDKFGPRKTFGACLFLSALSMVRFKT